MLRVSEPNESQNPVVSVIMAAFNSERFIGAAINSVLDQTHKAFELIVVDDGSTDSTPAILERYAAKDARIKVIRTANHGNAAARNVALTHARGDYIAVLDSDDVMAPNRLERQLDYLRHRPNVAVIGSYVKYINVDGKVVGGFAPSVTSSSELRALHNMGQTHALHHPSVMMRRSVVIASGGYRAHFEASADFDLWARLLDLGRDLEIQPEYLTYYRIHTGSLSLQKAVRQSFFRRYAQACSLARRRGSDEPSLQEYAETERSRGLPYRANRVRRDLGRVYYARAVRSYANSARPAAIVQMLASVVLTPRRTLFAVKSRLLPRSKD